MLSQTYVEATDVENDDSDLRVDGLVLLMNQWAVVHLDVKKTELNVRERLGETYKSTANTHHMSVFGSFGDSVSPFWKVPEHKKKNIHKLYY